MMDGPKPSFKLDAQIQSEQSPRRLLDSSHNIQKTGHAQCERYVMIGDDATYQMCVVIADSRLP